MYDIASKRKASKGSVQIKTSNNRLQLVFNFGGKRSNIVNPITVGAGFNHHLLRLAPLQQLLKEDSLHCNRLGLGLISGSAIS